MKFLYGFFGAVLGVMVGGAAASLVASATTADDDGAGLLVLLIAGPIGLIAGATAGAVLAVRARNRLLQKEVPLRQRLRPTLAVFLGSPVLTVVLLGLTGIVSRPPPNWVFLTRFRWHHAMFDRLAQMTQSDKKLMDVNDDSTDPADPKTVGVSSIRIAEYRRLLRDAGVPHGLSRTERPQGIEFTSWLQEHASTSKGYIYLTIAPAHTLPSLDGCEPNDQGPLVAYRHIEGHWYLFYEYIPD